VNGDVSGNLPFVEPEEQEHLCCVKDLLGPKAQAKGIVCPCAKCRAERGDQEVGPNGVRPASAQKPQDGKMAAAHDDSGQNDSQEEAERIYFERIRKQAQADGSKTRRTA
jgi:hypothetical protein